MQADEPRQDINRRERVELARLLLEEPLQRLSFTIPDASPLRRPLHLWSLTELESNLSEFWGPNIGQPGAWLAGSFRAVARRKNEDTRAIEVHTCYASVQNTPKDVQTFSHCSNGTNLSQTCDLTLPNRPSEISYPTASNLLCMGQTTS